MTRSELIEKIAEKCSGFTKRQVEIMFDTVIDSIKDALRKGERVEIRGFGNFTVKTRAPRIARNPKTGQTVEVPMKRAVHFKVGKELLEMMNPHITEVRSQKS
jgi:integration host factor beta subunit